MRLIKNIASNYLNQIWVALANIIAVPYYISTLGVQGFGLVGFLISLHGCFSIFDLGFAQVIAQENQKLKLNKITKKNFFNFIKTTNLIYLYISIFILIGLFLFMSNSTSLTLHLTKINEYSNSASTKNFFLLASMMIALRYMESFYRSFYIGLEFFHQFNFLNFIIIFLRNFSPFFFFNLFQTSISMYLYCQIILSLLVIIFFHFYTFAIKLKSFFNARFDWNEFYKNKDFVFSLFKASFLSVATSQIDKIFLIKYISLEDYGYFILAITISSGISMLISPITLVFYPKFTKSYIQKDIKKLAKDFHFAAQIVTYFIGILSVQIIFFRTEILLLWTSNNLIADKVSGYLAIYIIGTLINAFLWVPYQLQIAMKWMKLSLVTNSLSILLIIPAYIFLLPMYGVYAAASIWLFLNIVYFLISVNFMFSKILQNERIYWYIYDILIPILFITIILYIERVIFLNTFISRLNLFITLPIIFAVTFVSCFWVFKDFSLRKLSFKTY